MKIKGREKLFVAGRGWSRGEEVETVSVKGVGRI